MRQQMRALPFLQTLPFQRSGILQIQEQTIAKQG
jgi:hypothetical protein